MSSPSDRRAVRFNARDLLRSISSQDRLRSCGHRVVRAGGVQVRATFGADGAHAGFGGLSTCGSVWACPVCSAKVLAVRTREVEHAITAWQGQGGTVGMLTLTMRHDRGQRLGTLWDGLSGAWRALGKSYAWKVFRESSGLAHSYRATEVTHGRSGWHVHLHVLLFTSGPVGRHLSVPVFDAWSDALASLGFFAWSAVQDYREVGPGDAAGLADYLAKNTYPESTRAALEVTRSDLKDGKRGGRTPFGILRGLLAAAEADGTVDDGDLALWHEWEAASRGRRQGVWSRGARAALGIGEAVSDEDLAAVEVGTAVDTVLEIAPSAWSVLRSQPGWAAQLLAVVESCADHHAAFVAARAWLDTRGLAWWLPKEHDPIGRVLAATAV